MAALEDLRRRMEEAYRLRPPKSRYLHEQAQHALPGGDTRHGTAFRPYPTYVESARGSYLRDVDGNPLLDFTLNATSLIHGHAHAEIVAAIRRQAERGTAWAAPNPLQVRLAGVLTERMPALERVRFCNSGTEANMQAIKAARAFSGRDKILKMDGAYHGTYDGVEVNFAGTADGDGTPRVGPAMRGVPRNVADVVLVAPFGDREAAARLIEQHRRDLAAVVVNPVLTRGMLVLPPEGYLRFLREVTRACGVLLIFDEVITFRLAPGGAQELYGVSPDLTALGKIIGGGLPAGAFGGRADIMELYADGDSPSIAHAGTFNGNPLTMAAGLAAMDLLTAASYARLAELGARIQAELQAAVGASGLDLQVDRVASIVSLGVHAQVGAGRARAAAPAELLRLIHLGLLNRGLKTYAFFSASTVLLEAEIERLGAALREVLAELKPVVAEEFPELLRPAERVG